jgi:hypothetical protein
MIPSGYKEDTVFSAIPTDGSGDLSFTRASNGTRINSAGLVEVVPWNLLTYSSVLSDSSYTISELSRTDSQTDPNGGNTGALFTGTSATNAYILKSFSTIIGQVYTCSVYLKGNSSGSVSIRVDGAGTAPVNNVNYTTSYQQFTYTFTADSTTSTLIIGGYNTWLGSEAIYVAFPQANIGSTAKPYFPTTDRLNVPRLTYQNGGGGCPSLLLEKQSTNVAYYSNDLATAPNVVDASTTTANVYVSPDGTQNAMRFTETTAVDRHGFYQYTTVTAQTYTASIFTKQTGRRYISFVSDMKGVSDAAYFDLQTKTAINVASGYTCSVEDFGNGWLRLIVTFTATAGTRYVIWGGSPDGSSTFYGGSTSISQTFYGYQLEAGSYATSYIPTTSATATRVADFATTNNISSLFGSTEGSFFIEMTYDNTNPNGAIPLFLKSSTNSAYNYATYLQFGGNTVQFYVYNSGSAQLSITSGAIFTTGQKLKIAFAYKNNDFAIYVNGSSIGSSTSGNISSSLAFIDLGTYNQVPDTYRYNGAISEAVLFPTRLTNTQLAQLTA